MYFLQDDKRATADFKFAAKLPHAHTIVASIAAKNLLNESDSPEQAQQFLIEILKSSSDPISRKAIIERINDAQREIELRKLESAVAQFEKRFARKPTNISELITSGIVNSIGKDPFGGEYFIDPKTNEPTSSTRRKRFKLFHNKRAQCTAHLQDRC